VICGCHGYRFLLVNSFTPRSNIHRCAQRGSRRRQFERFHNSPALASALQGGFFLAKKPLEGFGYCKGDCGTAVGWKWFRRFLGGRAGIRNHVAKENTVAGCAAKGAGA
jgi:hypothetical protein